MSLLILMLQDPVVKQKRDHPFLGKAFSLIIMSQNNDFDDFFKKTDHSRHLFRYTFTPI